MIKTKEKSCRGTGKAKGYGCGEPNSIRIYGLGKFCRCYQKWLIGTEAGNNILNNTVFSTKTKIVKAKNKEKAKKKESLLSADGYRKKFIQPKINELARMIDNGQPCIATGEYSELIDGGHYFATGANRTLTFNLHNIHLQSRHSNSFKVGDDKRYRAGLERVYGLNYLEFIESMPQHPLIKLGKPFLIDLNSRLIEIRKDFKSQLGFNIFSPIERIGLRNKINNQIGIYNKEFSEFVK